MEPADEHHLDDAIWFDVVDDAVVSMDGSSESMEEVVENDGVAEAVGAVTNSIMKAF